MEVLLNKVHTKPILFSGDYKKSTIYSKGEKPIYNQQQSERLLTELDKMSSINTSSIVKNDFELNLSLDELYKRTDKEYLTVKEFLKPDSVEYTSLAKGDKEALKHLVKAADIVDKINMQLDNHHNLAFKEYLEKETSKGNEKAILTKVLFDAQRGMCSKDRNMQKIDLAKGISTKPGIGFYPEDLSKEEFHAILIDMLNNGKKEEVNKILNQRTVVERQGNELVGIDFVDKFSDDFKELASELREAAKTSTNEAFNEYLCLQAKALETADPMLDAYADKQWATLQDTPLEFTITRENYEDEFTETVLENPELKMLLDENGIYPLAKDTLGGRVGIINKNGTEDILKVKKYLPLMAENMPFSDEYEQSISQNKKIKQTMVDVDMVYATGHVGQYRGTITLAENLPNSDKLSLKVLDGGRRNVYHRQIRLITSANDEEQLKKRLDATLKPELHKYYNSEAYHWFTIGHENGHSLGPKNGKDSLGKYKSVIEENKADMISISMLDLLTDAGLYTPEQRKQIIVTFAIDSMVMAKPPMSKAHRFRSVMQNYFLIKEGAINISKDGILDVDIDKVVPATRKMLEQIIKLQMSGDIASAEKYVNDNFVWTPEMEAMAENIRKTSKALSGKLENKLADKLLNE